MSALPLCAKIGVLHGMIAGLLFGLWRLGSGMPVLAPQEFAWSVALLALFALLCSLFILVVVERYALRSIFWPVVVNVILVTLLTALVINKLPAHQFFILLSLWVGIVVGLFAGLLLCRLCFDRFTGGTKR